MWFPRMIFLGSLVYKLRSRLSHAFFHLWHTAIEDPKSKGGEGWYERYCWAAVSSHLCGMS